MTDGEGLGGRPGRGAATRRTGWVLALALVLLVVSAAVALAVGPADVTPLDIVASARHHVLDGLHALTGGAWPTTVPPTPLTTIQEAIVWQGRAPRLVSAAGVGAGLAIAGAVMQALLRNPLADPYLLGLSAGASLGAVAVLVLGVALLLPVAAFAGSLLALAATLALAGAVSRGRLTPGRTVLAGVAVAQGCAAITSFVIFTSVQGDSYREVLGWLLGTLGGTTWTSAAIAWGALAVVGSVLLASGRTLDAFAFGDTAARALGVDVTRTRWLLLGATALLTGALVSVSGAIGFVGLVVPHAVRTVVGGRHVRVLPLSLCAGAMVLLWADTAARVVIEPRELPVGILTAAIGAPVFALLLARRGRGEAG
ncbi:iron complex transport system permease protein [Salana multivorans]|uniref:Iron complex transport system permease protein n=1 Tax=Salana multivorans TaxID=120377 RepID=A0A3N2D2K2_9MICO|nr:iron complex transport system permease protein [Salana multivorans]